MMIQSWNLNLFFVNNTFSVHSINSMDFILHFPGDIGVSVTSSDVGTEVLQVTIKTQVTHVSSLLICKTWLDTPSGRHCQLVTWMHLQCKAGD